MRVGLLRSSANGARLERWDDVQGTRWRLQWGPSDIFISVSGEQSLIAEGLERAWHCFEALLPGLVKFLPMLRSSKVTEWLTASVGENAAERVANRMGSAVLPYAQLGLFITPMAAVAGSIAQEILSCFDCERLQKIVVNNGGDIAFHLSKPEQLRCGVYGHGSLILAAGSGVQGVATSGLGGRSFTLGIADSVTVIAASAALADAAATMIANAVTIDDPRIGRSRASSLRDDTDLGDLLVTTDVPPLPPELVANALLMGVEFAKKCHALGLIRGALLSCQQQIQALDMEGILQ